MNVGVAASNTLAQWKHTRPSHALMPEPKRSEDGTGACHAHWMLLEVIDHEAAKDWKNDKLNRWLGYAQAILVMMKYLSLEEVKKANLQA